MIHSLPDLHAVNFGDGFHNAVPHAFQYNHYEEKHQGKHEKKKGGEHAHNHVEHENNREEAHHHEHDKYRHHHWPHEHQHGLGYNLHHLQHIHHVGHYIDDDHQHSEDFNKQEGQHDSGIAPSGRSLLDGDHSSSIDVYKPYEFVDDGKEDTSEHLVDNEEEKEHHEHKQHHRKDKKNRKFEHLQLHEIYEHEHHHENPIVHLHHDEDVHEDPGKKRLLIYCNSVKYIFKLSWRRHL